MTAVTVKTDFPGERFLTRGEFFLLGGFLLFLPLAEAPKNLFLFGLFGYWAYGSATAKNFGVGTKAFEWPLLAIFLMSLVPVFQREAEHIRALNNCVDFCSIVLLTILVGRSRLHQRQAHWLAVWAMVGVGSAVAYGVWRGGQFPSLHSVGHINQVAMYLGLMLVAASSALMLADTMQERITLTVASVLLAFLVVSTGSRNALFGVALALALALILMPASVYAAGMRHRALVAGLVLLLVFIAAAVYRPPALVKQINQTASNQSIVDNARQSLWRSSYLVAKQAPLFGYGVGFFGEGHTPTRVEELVVESGHPFERNRYVWTNHAHNLVMNWLVERGWIATAVLLTWIFYVFVLLASAMIRRGGVVRNGPLSDYAGLMVLSATVFFGLGNTSWHHEHGLLAGLIIGVAWSLRNAPSPSSLLLRLD